MEDFNLEGREYIELNNLLKLTGFCASGGLAKLAVDQGEVLVNGQVELRKRCKIRSGQVVSYAGQQIQVI